MKSNLTIAVTSLAASIILLIHSNDILLCISIVIFLFTAIFYAILALLSKWTIQNKAQAEAQIQAQAEAKARKQQFMRSYERIRNNL